MQKFDVESPGIKERIIAGNHLAFSFLTHIPIVPGHAADKIYFTFQYILSDLKSP